MYTLFIDTHTAEINIILYKEKQIFIKKTQTANYNHSRTTMPIIVEILKEAEIEINEINEIIVVNGPGSFTGVRIGVVIAKTLAFTLKIPIKIMSSLLIKAVSLPHEEDIKIIEKEKNGAFLGTFNKKNELKNEYLYINNEEYKSLNKEEYDEEVVIDYEKIIQYASNLIPQNPHAVNPLYVKKIEVQK